MKIRLKASLIWRIFLEVFFFRGIRRNEKETTFSNPPSIKCFLFPGVTGFAFFPGTTLDVL